MKTRAMNYERKWKKKDGKLDFNGEFKTLKSL
jgi:aryl carrier-like protein